MIVSPPGNGMRRKGFTLTELCVVMFILVVLMLLLTTTLLGALRAHKLAGLVSDRALAQDALAEEFRNDVARATAAPTSTGRLVAGPNLLILRIEDRTVVYAWDGERLERSESRQGKWSHRPLSLGDRMSVEFDRSPDGKFPRIRLFEHFKMGKSKRVADFVAARGGDLR